MGSYLGRPGPSASARVRAGVQERLVGRRPSQPLCQVQRVQRVHPAPRHRPARRPRHWDPAHPSRLPVNEAWRRFPMRKAQISIAGPFPSDWWESYLKRSIWSLRHPRRTWSPVTVKISPPERRVPPSISLADVIASAEPPEEPPDPSSKETVLKALRECRKASRRPLPELLRPQSRRSGSETPRSGSAFKPLSTIGACASFVPRPGLLKKSLHSWSAAHSRKRPSYCPEHPRGPLSTKRNAISSSYSSSRDFSQPRKRSFSDTILETPEWPVKKKGTSHRPVSPVPLASDSSGQHKKIEPLLPSPGNPLSTAGLPQSGRAASDEDPSSGKEAEPKQSNKARADTVQATPQPDPEPRCGVQPSLSLTLSPSETVPLASTNPQLKNLERKWESADPPASPQPAGQAAGVAPASLKMPGLPAAPEYSQPDPLTSASADPELTATSLMLNSDTTQPLPQSSLPVVTHAAPDRESAVFSTMRDPTPLPASVPPASASTYPALRPNWGPLHNGEIRGSLYSRISVTAAASSSSSLSTTPGISSPTFQPVFGSGEPLSTPPVIAPATPRPPSPPPIPAAPQLQGLAQACPGAMSATPASPAAGSAFKPSSDFSIVNSSDIAGGAFSVPASCHTFLLGAGFSPATGFLLVPHQNLATYTVHTITVFTQIISSVIQMSLSRSRSDAGGVGSSESALALSLATWPAFSPGASSLIPTLLVPLGLSSGPPFSLSTGDAPPPADGATDGQRHGSPQSAPAPSFIGSLPFGSSAVASSAPVSAPAQPLLGCTPQSAPGWVAPSACAAQAPAGTQLGPGSPPAGCSQGQVSLANFGDNAQNHQNGACGSVFGITAPRPFAFGGVVTPMDCGEPGMVLKGATSTITPGGDGWSLPSPNTPLSLGRASISARKTMFGAFSVPPLAQSTPISGPVKANGSLGFGMSSPPSQGSIGTGQFRSSGPSFSIGAKSTSRNREPGRSRRHYAHKK